LESTHPQIFLAQKSEYDNLNSLKEKINLLRSPGGRKRY
jgi:hypothetical protein